MRLGPIKLQAMEKKFCKASQRLGQMWAQEGAAICTMSSLGGWGLIFVAGAVPLLPVLLRFMTATPVRDCNHHLNN